MLTNFYINKQVYLIKHFFWETSIMVWKRKWKYTFWYFYNILCATFCNLRVTVYITSSWIVGTIKHLGLSYFTSCYSIQVVNLFTMLYMIDWKILTIFIFQYGVTLILVLFALASGSAIAFIFRNEVSYYISYMFTLYMYLKSINNIEQLKSKS